MIFSVVDKKNNEYHSFVDGFLCSAIAKSFKKNFLFVFRNHNEKLAKRNKAIQVPFTLKRSIIGRLLSPFEFFFYFFVIFIKQDLDRNENIVLFLRNEITFLPSFLLIKLLLKCAGFKLKVVFQSSFPHENSINNYILRMFVKNYMRIMLHWVDKVLVVSEESKKRINKLNKNVDIGVIPLCLGYKVPQKPQVNFFENNFLYIGTHSKARKLSKVFRVFAYLDQLNIKFTVTSVGANFQEISDLLKDDNIELLVKKGKLRFIERVNQKELVEFMKNSNFGLNLIPVEKIYIESSSTKLGEYCSYGLPIFSSQDIPYHSYAHSFGLGYLIDFDKSEKEVANEIGLILSNLNQTKYEAMSVNSYSFAKDQLNYANFTSELSWKC